MHQIKSSRRNFLGKISQGALLLSSIPALCSAKDADKPNIIYILADDLGYGDLGCFGQKTLKTPNIDKMAREGITLTQHYAGSTVCAPSRAVLVTGLHTGHVRIRNNSFIQLKDSDVTFGHVLKKAGYRTGCIGKWGVGNILPDNDPARGGMDYFYGYINMCHAHNFYPDYIVKNGKRLALRNTISQKWKDLWKKKINQEGSGVADKKIDYVPDMLQKETLAFISRNKDKPFFLYYSLNMPHANNEGKNTPDGMEVPSYGEFKSRPWPDNEKGFAMAMKLIDDYTGQVIKKVKDSGLEKKTLIIFTSDNGPHNEGGHDINFFNSNGDLRGYKRDLYEGGIRVPFIAKWKNRIKPGKKSSHLSGFQDMMPTFAELAGVKSPPCDGISMAPILSNRPGSQKKHDHLYWEFPIRKGLQAVVKGKWKGVRKDVKKKPDGPIELYDLSADISEKNNIAKKHLQIVSEISGIMKKEHIPLDKLD